MYMHMCICGDYQERNYLKLMKSDYLKKSYTAIFSVP